MRLSHVAPLVFVACGCSLAAIACGSSAKRNTFGDNPTGGPSSSATTSPTFAPPGTCAGLACKQVACGDPNTTTTLTGKVYDPAAANPLYNVIVYIPGGPNGDDPLPPLSEGASCDQCSSVALNPLVSALTDETGTFTLKNVPVTQQVPIVIQIGKWRRKLAIDINNKCQDNPVPDRMFRLPKNGTEGDMPQIAVTAGGCDALECLLRGIGIDDSEFVPGYDPSQAGHVHVFTGDGGKGVPGSPPAGGTTANPTGGFLWNDATKMQPFDMVMMSCECDEHNENKGGNPGAPGARQAMWDYANLGGRIFATHYHYTWFKNSPQPDWQALASWGSSNSSSNTYDVDQSFPKGVSFAEWLVAVNASSTLGKIDLQDVTDSLTSVHAPAQSWIAQGSNDVKYFSFNSPTSAPDDMKCGRAVYSDLHVSGISSGGQVFPTGCPSAGGLSAQQKALEFMFFDLSSCIQSDSQPPVVPH